MRKFVTIHDRVKRVNNRFGGDNRRFDKDDDLPEEKRTSRQNRREARLKLRSALVNGDFTNEIEEGS